MKLTLVLAVLMAVVGYSTESEAATKDQLIEVPAADAIPRAVEYVRSLVGVEIYDRDFCQTSTRTAKGFRPTSVVTFHFTPPASPWVDVEFEISVQDSGKCSPHRDWIIPECTEEPERCMVDIYREEAIEIAEGHGFPVDKNEWKVELRTLRRFAGFVWVILKRESARTTRVLVINAFNGDVLEEHLSEWIE